jgi:ketosteroid isomerase-like protein
MAHPNEDLVRRGYAAFGQGDMQTLDELFTDDIEWHAPGNSPVSGDFTGKPDVFGLFGRLGELSGGSLHLELHDVLANDQHAVGLGHATAQRDGRQLDDNQVIVFHLSGGKVSSAWVHTSDQQANDAFWS